MLLNVTKKFTILLVFIFAVFSMLFFSQLAYAADNNIPAGCPGGPSGPKAPGTDCSKSVSQNDGGTTQPNGTFSTGDGKYKTINDICGSGDDAVGMSIKIGCKGKGNPIADMTFAIIRILSDGVGLVVIASIIVGGIQYTGSRGDPQSTAMAVNRIRSSVFALIIFIFGYAILNFIIPAGFLQ